MNDALRKLALLTIILLALVAASGCGTGSGKTPEPSKPSDPTPVVGQAPKEGDPPKPENASTAQDRRQLLEAVGALTAANCYQTYLNIGLIADGKAKGTYTTQDASKVLDSVLSLLNSVDRNLAAVAKIQLDKRDRESLEQMRDLSALLRLQGKELQAYWDSGKEEDGTKYDSTRKDSWAAIGRLTGIGR
jgi:hypothetical protein